MQNDLINGRTPEHIKAGLRCRVTGDTECSDCAYYGTVLYEIGQREYECDDIDRDALALIERLESERNAALAKVPRWISVEERLPTEEDANEEGRVACVLSKMYGSMAGERRFYPWDIIASHPTLFAYWMSLPEPPKGDA